MTWAKSSPKFARAVIFLGAAFSLLIIPALHPLSTAAQSGGVTHTVQVGENLFRIALHYNTTVEALAAANGISDPTRIYVGQVLVIPGSDAAAPAPVPLDPAAAAPAPAPVPAVEQGPVYHAVQPGETLASIARTYGVTWPDIANANGLANANQIYSGQQLLIPGTSAPNTAAVAPP